MRSGGRVVRAEPVFRKPLPTSTLTRWVGVCFFQHVNFLKVSTWNIYLGSMVFTCFVKEGYQSVMNPGSVHCPCDFGNWRTPKYEDNCSCRVGIRRENARWYAHECDPWYIYPWYVLIAIYFTVLWQICPNKMITFAAICCYTKGTHQGGEGLLWETWRTDEVARVARSSCFRTCRKLPNQTPSDYQPISSPGWDQPFSGLTSTRARCFFGWNTKWRPSMNPARRGPGGNRWTLTRMSLIRLFAQPRHPWPSTWMMSGTCH